MKVGDTITLKPKSKHGKDRIHQHGTVWKVRLMAGGRIFLESSNKTFRLGDHTNPTMTKDARWVDLSGDKDFEIREGK